MTKGKWLQISFRAHRCGFGNLVITKIEEDVDHIKQTTDSGRAVKLPINILVSLISVVSHGDDFTLVTRMQPFMKFNL